MFCRHCRYDLQHLERSACPECGAAFDANDTRTFHAVPDAPWLGVAILVASFLLALALRWLLLVSWDHLPPWLQVGDWTVAIVVILGVVAAGCRADLSVIYFYDGALLCLLLMTVGESALLDWLTVGPMPLIGSTLLSILILVASMFGCWALGRLSWHWGNRRRALAARRLPRPRSAWRRWLTLRRIAGGLGLIALVGAAWVTYELCALLRSAPNVAVNYHDRLAASFAAATMVDVDRANAAWAELVDALTLMELTRQTFDDATRQGAFKARAEWDDGAADYSAVRLAWDDPDDVRRERDALAALAAAGVFTRVEALVAGPMPNRPAQSTPVPNPPMITRQLPALRSMRQLARAQAASMRFAAAAGNFAESAAHFDALMACAEMLSHQQTSIDWLVAAAIVALGVDELGYELTEADFDEASCRRLLRTFEERRIASIERSLEGEQASFHDAVQRTFTDDGHGDGYCHPPSAARLFGGVPGPGGGGLLPNTRAAYLARFRLASRREQLERYDGVMDALLVEARLPPHARWAGDVQPDDLAARVRPRHHFATAFLPTASYLDADGRLRSQIAGTRTLVALELFRARHGRWPRSLAELVPAIVPSIPVDPLTGEAFGYRHLGAEDERPFVLYSFGADGVDDGGAYDPRRATAGWSDDSAGVDVPFNRARETPEW